MFDVILEGSNIMSQMTTAAIIDRFNHAFVNHLGAGERLFDGVPEGKLEMVSGRSASLVQHITYRIIR